MGNGFVGFVEFMEFVEFIELKHSRKSGAGSRETVMSRTTVASNVELLRWIPAPALDPDPGSAGMTVYTKKFGVRSSFFGSVPLVNASGDHADS